MNRRPARLRWLAPLVLAGLVFAALVALAPDYLYHWDEIQLALGAERFDPLWHRPHPPGYYGFVVASRAADALAPAGVEPGRLVAALAAAAFVALVGVRLPAALAPAPTLLLQLAAALFVLGCPLVAFFALSGLTYVVEGVLWTAIGLGVAARPRGRGLAALALGVGLAAGVRPTLLVWSAVLCALAWLRCPGWIGPRELARGAPALCAGLVAWMVPMLHEAGGADRYLEATARIGAGNVWSKSVFVEGPGVLATRLPRMLSDLVAAGGWALVPALAGLLPGAPAAPDADARERRDALLACAALALGFYALVIYDTPGYALSFVLPLAAFGILETARLAAARAAAVQAFSAAGLAALLLAWTWLLRSPETSPEAYASHDRDLRARFAAVRRLDPDTTLLVTSREYWRYAFRHVMYYLPEYTTLQLVRDPFFVGATDDAPYLTARHHEVWTSGPEGVDLAALRPFGPGAPLERIVYMVPFDGPAFIAASCRAHLRARGLDNGEQLPVLALRPGLSVHVRDERLHCAAGGSGAVPGQRGGGDQPSRIAAAAPSPERTAPSHEGWRR